LENHPHLEEWLNCRKYEFSDRFLMTSPATIVLYTANYPFEGGEPFIADELTHLVKHFDKVILVPYHQKGEQRPVPNGVEVVDWRKWSQKGVIKASLGRIIMDELRHGEKRSAFVRHFRAMRYILKQRGYEAVALQQFIEAYHLQQAVHYTYWFDHWTLSLAILKDEGMLNKLVSRAHGYDLYHDRAKTGLIPFRQFVLSLLNAVFLISQNGKQYLSDRFPHYANRMHLSYLGTSDAGIATSELPKVFTMVSCSTAKPLKRLDLLFEAFIKLPIPAKWIHIGEGQSLVHIRARLGDVPSHLDVELKGNLTNNEVLEFYKNEPLSLFVNVSETEGLPVSIMEAISFGIPVLATDAGGTSEIVKAISGELIPVDISADNLSHKLEAWAYKTTQVNREEIRTFWKENFSADNNYHKFCTLLKSIE
jgi:glycosyltransferase involved in cell wall biosynthesis